MTDLEKLISIEKLKLKKIESCRNYKARLSRIEIIRPEKQLKGLDIGARDAETKSECVPIQSW